jgi:hypothetical protein
VRGRELRASIRFDWTCSIGSPAGGISPGCGVMMMSRPHGPTDARDPVKRVERVGVEHKERRPAHGA